MREFTLIMMDKNFNTRRQVMMAETIGEAVLKADAIMRAMDITVVHAGLYTATNPRADYGVLQVAHYEDDGWIAGKPKGCPDEE